MAPSMFVLQMNRSLETKLALYKNMAEYVEQRPVIFTSRAEIWSTDRNSLIITGHPFPSISSSDNRYPGELTEEMMEHYQNLPTVTKRDEGRDFNLILFEFEVRGTTELHALFVRHGSPTEKMPPEMYLERLVPTEILIRRCSTESSSVETLKIRPWIVLASEIRLARKAWISGNIRRFLVPTMSDEARDTQIDSIESRLGPEMCKNLEEKVELFHASATPDVHGVTFTSVPDLWESEIPWMVIKNRLPRIPADYNHKFFDIERDIFDYISHVTRRKDAGLFFGYSRRFGDSQFADVHLLFARNDELAPSLGPLPSLLSLSSDSGVRGPPVPPRSQATIQHSYSAIPAVKADVDVFASGAGRPLSFESPSSDPGPSVPPVPPRTEITTVDYRPLTTSEEENIGESRSSDSTSRDPLLPPSTSTEHRRYSSSAVADVDRTLSFDATYSSQFSTSANLVPAVYRSYSSATSLPRTFIQREVKVRRDFVCFKSLFEELESSSSEDDSSSGSSTSSSGSSISSSCPSRRSQETGDTSEYDNDEEMGPLARRLGVVLLRYLDTILRLYAVRSAEAKHRAHIFTDDPNMWRRDRDPKITFIDLPPIPLRYDHERNDVVQDIVDYLNISYSRQNADAPEPFFVSTLQFGSGSCVEVHILLSRYQERVMQYYFRAELGPTLDLPSSRVHSMPEVRDMMPAQVPQTSAGLTDAQAGGAPSPRHARSVPTEFESEDSMDNLPDIPEGRVFPRNPDEYVP